MPEADETPMPRRARVISSQAGKETPVTAPEDEGYELNLPDASPAPLKRAKTVAKPSIQNDLDDDEEDVRPSRRKSESIPKKKSNTLLIVGGVFAGVLAVCTGLVGYVGYKVYAATDSLAQFTPSTFPAPTVTIPTTPPSRAFPPTTSPTTVIPRPTILPINPGGPSASQTIKDWQKKWVPYEAPDKSFRVDLPTPHGEPVRNNITLPNTVIETTVVLGSEGPARYSARMGKIRNNVEVSEEAVALELLKNAGTITSLATQTNINRTNMTRLVATDSSGQKTTVYVLKSGQQIIVLEVQIQTPQIPKYDRFYEIEKLIQFQNSFTLQASAAKVAPPPPIKQPDPIPPTPLPQTQPGQQSGSTIVGVAKIPGFQVIVMLPEREEFLTFANTRGSKAGATMRHFSSVTWKEIATQKFPFYVQAATFDPESKRLLLTIASEFPTLNDLPRINGTTELRSHRIEKFLADPETDKPLQTFKPDSFLQDAAFSPDGKTIYALQLNSLKATPTAKNFYKTKLLKLDAESLKVLKELEYPNGHAGLSISTNGKQLATWEHRYNNFGYPSTMAGSEGVIHFVDLAKFEKARAVNVAFSPLFGQYLDEKTLILSGVVVNNTVIQQITSTTEAKPLYSPGEVAMSGNPVSYFAIEPKSQKIVLSGFRQPGARILSRPEAKGDWTSIASGITVAPKSNGTMPVAGFLLGPVAVTKKHAVIGSGLVIELGE